MKSKFSKKLAFTMAEAILVMTILGIIATIMISTLKPAEFKDQALTTMARKVLSEIDNTFTMFELNPPHGSFNHSNGTAYSYTNMKTLISQGDRVSPRCQVASQTIVNLFKQHLTTLRDIEPYTSVATNPYNATYADQLLSCSKGFYLKDGAYVAFAFSPGGRIPTVFPGETKLENEAWQSFIFFDSNGNEEPNVFGKDQFVLPIRQGKIGYVNY